MFERHTHRCGIRLWFKIMRVPPQMIPDLLRYWLLPALQPGELAILSKRAEFLPVNNQTQLRLDNCRQTDAPSISTLHLPCCSCQQQIEKFTVYNVKTLSQALRKP